QNLETKRGAFRTGRNKRETKKARSRRIQRRRTDCRKKSALRKIGRGSAKGRSTCFAAAAAYTQRGCLRVKTSLEKVISLRETAARIGPREMKIGVHSESEKEGIYLGRQTRVPRNSIMHRELVSYRLSRCTVIHVNLWKWFTYGQRCIRFFSYRKLNHKNSNASIIAKNYFVVQVHRRVGNHLKRQMKREDFLLENSLLESSDSQRTIKIDEIYFRKAPSGRFPLLGFWKIVLVDTGARRVAAVPAEPVAVVTSWWGYVFVRWKIAVCERSVSSVTSVSSDLSQGEVRHTLAGSDSARDSAKRSW
ncbi:hypothetical protein ALC57_13582, partial [Trachymyrmex cornetzi]